jgi:4-hydroxy-3-methylbut-2-enyl diphosphate reductase
MGQCEGTIYLVENVDDVARLSVKHPDKLGVVTQTTLSQDDAKEIIDALIKRFPNIVLPRKEDICYATQNRQNAVRKLASRVDVMIVVGSPNSSNSNRLREVAARLGKPTYQIDRAEELQQHLFDHVKLVGITAGASAPEVLVQDVVARLTQWGVQTVTEDEGVKERVVFMLPKVLYDPQ